MPQIGTPEFSKAVTMRYLLPRIKPFGGRLRKKPSHFGVDVVETDVLSLARLLLPSGPSALENKGVFTAIITCGSKPLYFQFITSTQERLTQSCRNYPIERRMPWHHLRDPMLKTGGSWVRRWCQAEH